MPDEGRLWLCCRSESPLISLIVAVFGPLPCTHGLLPIKQKCSDFLLPFCSAKGMENHSHSRKKKCSHSRCTEIAGHVLHLHENRLDEVMCTCQMELAQSMFAALGSAEIRMSKKRFVARTVNDFLQAAVRRWLQRRARFREEQEKAVARAHLRRLQSSVFHAWTLLTRRRKGTFICLGAYYTGPGGTLALSRLFDGVIHCGLNDCNALQAPRRLAGFGWLAVCSMWLYVWVYRMSCPPKQYGEEC
jgi:hypothetical protein